MLETRYRIRLASLMCLIIVHCICRAVPAQTLDSEITRILDTNNSIAPILDWGVDEKVFVRHMYQRRSFTPLWTSDTQIQILLGLIEDSSKDGLEPNDYHLSRLRKLALNTAQGNVSAIAEYDILLTDAFIRLAYHLRFGKANPVDLDSNWNFSRALITKDPAAWLLESIALKTLRDSLKWLRPNTRHYQVLRKTLVRYRGIELTGGWPTLADGPTLKPSMTSDRVIELRARLAVTGAMIMPQSGENDYYDSTLAEAVRMFQRRHGLEVDGWVGSKTRAALNISVSEKINTLRVNLERIRWVFRDIEDEYLSVNIADYSADYVKDNHVVWSARAVVGRPYRQTPSFKALMQYAIFNPTWTVPPTILNNDIIPAMRIDRSYLQRKGLRVVSRNGDAIDPHSITWENFNSRNFPYLIKQGPGDNNALGRVKFIFPNSHLVYLHDTPSKSLFERTERTFSSGCIRIENPFELANALFAGHEKWNPEELDSILADGRPRRVDLEKPIPVMILYLTSFATDANEISFRRDVYARDAAVLDRLNGPFKFSPPQGFSLNEK